MKLLIVSYFFPPCATGAAAVMHNLCKNLPDYNYRVITASEGLCARQGAYDKEYALDCTAIRLPVCTTRLIDQIIYLFLAVLSGVVLNWKEKIHSILAVYPSHFDLLAGYALHRLLKKPLIVYMHDLFSENHRNALLYNVWFYFEKLVLLSASKVLVMNAKYVEHYSGRGIHHTTVLPPSIDLAEYANLDSTRPRFGRDPRKLQIVFTGSIGGEQEEAVLALLEAAIKLDYVEVHIASPSGKRSMKEQVYKYAKEVNVGFLPKEECIGLQKSADVLFLPLSGPYPHREEIRVAFPCKLLEYLAAGKPILALVQRGSFVESFVSQYEIGIAVNELSVEKIKAAIDLLRSSKLREVFSKNELRTVKLFDSRTLSKQLLRIINDVEEKAK
jgi:glycosyltransferase involved in cell wall biosynthesis